MNKQELLEELKNIKETTEKNHPGYVVKDVIHYNKKVKMVNEDGNIEDFDLTVVLIKNAESNEGYKLYYLDGKEVPIIELLKNRELLNSIQRVIDETKENQSKPEEEQDEELKKESLKELELEKEKETEEKSEEQESEEDKETILTSDTAGATSLEQQIDRRSLRDLIGLEPDDTYIKPISASEAKRKYGININTKEGIEIIKKDGRSRLAGEDIFRQDVQEGNNSFDRDLNLEVDGSLEYKSNTTSLELVNMPNHYISMGYDELSTKKEIKFSKRSGREGHREPEKELLKQGASEYQDPDQRNMLRRNEEGIGEGDEIRKRQQALEEAGANNDRVENIDNYNDNDIYFIDPDEKIEDTDVTWRDLANKLRIQRRRWYSKSI